MSSLPTRHLCYFGEYDWPLKEAKIALLGVPFFTSALTKPPISSTLILRYFSYEVEDNSILFPNLYYGDIKCTDIGDLYSTEHEQLIKNLKKTVSILTDLGKKVVLFGGEHVFTYYIIKLLKPKTMVVLDAHFDAKDSYLDDRLNYATFIRRIAEEEDVFILFYGVRAYEREERKFINDLIDKGRANIVTSPEEISGIEKPIYVSIDLDVYDPYYMRLVSSPEVNGLSPNDVFNMLKRLSLEGGIIGGDVMEFMPYQIDIASTYLAVRTIFEIIALIWYSLGQF